MYVCMLNVVLTFLPGGIVVYMAIVAYDVLVRDGTIYIYIYIYMNKIRLVHTIEKYQIMTMVYAYTSYKI